MSQTQSTLQGFDDGEQPPKPSDELSPEGPPKCECLWPDPDEIERVDFQANFGRTTREVHTGGCGGVVVL